MTELVDTRSWAPALDGLGFEAGDTRRSFQRGALKFEIGARWSELCATARGTRDSEIRGPWKVLGRGAARRFSFDIPPLASQGGVDAADGGSLQTEVLEWAMRSLAGEPSPDWTPPPADEIEPRVADRLTVRAGTASCQGRLHLEPDRLALEFSLASLPKNLAPARRWWLRQLVADAQARWRMVRVRCSVELGIRAEVDLTGAPHCALPSLVPAAVDALHCVVGWLLPPVSMVLRTDVVSAVLDSPRSTLTGATPSGDMP